jgi:hypothetical protein
MEVTGKTTKSAEYRTAVVGISSTPPSYNGTINDGIDSDSRSYGSHQIWQA